MVELILSLTAAIGFVVLAGVTAVTFGHRRARRRGPDERDPRQGES